MSEVTVVGYVVPQPDVFSVVGEVLVTALEVADVSRTEGFSTERAVLDSEAFEAVRDLAKARHAARGVAITLMAYKIARPSQDIRAHKAELDGGFSARTVDSRITVPFLNRESLPSSVETHWLSQTFSFAGLYVRDAVLRTQPRHVGENFLKVVNSVEDGEAGSEVAKAMLVVLLGELIEERNRGKVLLEKPKDLPIDDVLELLEKHFDSAYEKNSPRLPQLALYAIYDVLTRSVDRYKDMELQPLERMRAANRKSGTVGDIDLNGGGIPLEAVEVKFGIKISKEIVAEAIQKIRTASVERYFILSTAGVKPGDEVDIRRLRRDFRRSNGCEIIVNGVIESIGYYLRLIRSTTDFVVAYAQLVEVDSELGYEHRIAWNRVCGERIS